MRTDWVYPGAETGILAKEEMFSAVCTNRHKDKLTRMNLTRFSSAACEIVCAFHSFQSRLSNAESRRSLSPLWIRQLLFLPPELLPGCDERSAHSCTVKFDVFIVHKAWFILKYIQYLISSTLTGLNIGRVYVCLWAYWSVSTRNVKRATPVLSGGKSQDSVRTKITLNSPPLTLCGAWKRPAGLMNALAHTQRARSTLRCFPGNLEGQNNDFHNVSLQRRREQVRVAEEESKREREWGRALSFPWL